MFGIGQVSCGDRVGFVEILFIISHNAVLFFFRIHLPTLYQRFLAIMFHHVLATSSDLRCINMNICNNWYEHWRLSVNCFRISHVLGLIPFILFYFLRWRFRPLLTCAHFDHRVCVQNTKRSIERRATATTVKCSYVPDGVGRWPFCLPISCHRAEWFFAKNHLYIKEFSYVGKKNLSPVLDSMIPISSYKMTSDRWSANESKKKVDPANGSLITKKLFIEKRLFFFLFWIWTTYNVFFFFLTSFLCLLLFSLTIILCNWQF